MYYTPWMLTRSTVFAAASEVAVGPMVICFPDFDIEGSAVVKLFLRFLTGPISLDKNIHSTDTLVRLVRFCHKWDCPSVTNQITMSLRDALLTRAMSAPDVCIVAAALDNLILCQKAVEMAATLAKTHLPWRGVRLSVLWKPFIPLEYHDALQWEMAEDSSGNSHGVAGEHGHHSRFYSPRAVALEFRKEVENASAQMLAGRRMLRWVEETSNVKEFHNPAA